MIDKLKKIRKLLTEAKTEFNGISSLGQRKDATLVEAKADIIRAGRKVNILLEYLNETE